jgi:hypothetical protein
MLFIIAIEQQFIDLENEMKQDIDDLNEELRSKLLHIHPGK